MAFKIALPCFLAVALLSASALASDLTCFEAGECREGQHLEGDPASDQFQCLENCKQNQDCQWFTFFPQLGYCQLFSDCPVLDQEFCSDCSSGQAGCSAPEPVCFVPGECQGSVDHVKEATSQENCLELCQSDDSCRWFTYHSTTSACILYHDCDQISTDCNECVSGESSCQLATTTDLPPTSTTPSGHYVYLSGGSSGNEGNVFAYNPHKNIIGPVCDDFWDFNDALVVCRQLGFAGVETVHSGSYFGNVYPTFAYEKVDCTGDEASLDDCPWTGLDDCGFWDGAGVVCSRSATTSEGTTTEGTTTEATTSEPVGHYVELEGGSAPNEGNVIAYNPHSGVLGPVCDDFWDLNDATVVCRQLGYAGVERVYKDSFFGPVANEFSYDSTHCKGEEATLDDCFWSSNEDCGYWEGAGVVCSISTTTSEGTTTEATTSEPVGHYVELVGGSAPNEGNVYAQNPVTGIYGPVCDDGFDLNAANVVCKQLGFTGASAFHTESHYGYVSHVFSYDDISCESNEGTLDDCQHSNFENCGPNEGAGVECVDHYVELVGGSAPNEGNVHAKNPVTGIYGPVCDDGFDLNAANVVCKQLNFTGAVAVHSESFYGHVNHIFSYDDISCNSNEGTLDDCLHSNSENCSPIEGAGVQCYKVELVGGSSSSEGNVFATNPRTNVHGPICDDNWTEVEADIICKMLGFKRSLQATVGSHFGSVPSTFAFDDVDCDFSNPNLFSCDYSDQDNCESNEGAGVVCETS